MRNFVKTVSALLILSVIAISVVIGYYFCYLPDSYYVTKGTNLKICCKLDIKATNNKTFVPSQIGDENQMGSGATLKLFGVIPIKEVKIKEVNTPVLIPGGNPFGIKLLSEGVMVIGTAKVDSVDGDVCPALDCGIEVGDIIYSINGEKMVSNQSIADAILSSSGEKVVVELKRNSKAFKVDLEPVYSLSEASYKAGMWVRDSSAGIGTITFYDPQTEIFGGLGHPVCDSDTGNIIPLHSGEVVGVNINGVVKGQSGQPGELIGSFVSNFSVGKLLLNNQSGLFGELNSAPNLSTPIPLGYRQEIETGPATILTTIKGNTPKEYNIEIEKIDLKNNGESKNMIIKISDKELLEETGGILQGMSGSPIIQNGKLVGAVTHVFVNDPTKGYAVFVDTMYDYAMQLNNNQDLAA